jgi:hypothetical protein
MAKFTLIKVDGSKKILSSKKPELSELQKAVGGYIEVIKCEEGNLYVNEEGRLMGLAKNIEASLIAGVMVVGDAVLETKK